MEQLSGRKVAVLLEEGFEDLELWVTVMRRGPAQGPASDGARG
jgi:hypothetical protein